MAHAEGYVGAVAALTSIGGGCDARFSECDKKGFGLKIYFGSRFAPSNQLDFGVGKLESIEIGAINFGKSDSRGTVVIPGADSVDPTLPGYFLGSTTATANALIVAGVARVPVADNFVATAKAGAAYVSSTIKYFIAGASNGSVTATKLQPYIGLGLELDVGSGLKIVGSYDWTRFNVESQKGNLGALGVGAQFGF